MSDPDLGKIGPGHVCKHGIRWPHPCDPCDDEAWSEEVVRRVSEGFRSDIKRILGDAPD